MALHFGPTSDQRSASGMELRLLHYAEVRTLKELLALPAL